MKRILALVLTAGVAALGAACDDSPVAPAPTPVTFTAQLSSANEVPAITGPEASGSGDVTITLNVTRNAASTITNATADFQVNLTGFPAGTPITMAHIHVGGVGTIGGIVVDTGVVAGQVTLVNGAGVFAKTGIAVDAALAQSIIDTSSGYYFNVHSVLNGSGVVRGQLVKQ